MSCNQLPLLRRITVEAPEALDAESWRSHLADCGECRAARYALDRSLAVYRQVESQVRTEEATGPSWEALAATLEREQRWQRLRSRMRVPLAVASVSVAVGIGALLWPAGAGFEHPLPQSALVENEAGREDRRRARSGLEMGEFLLRELAEASLASALPAFNARADASPAPSESSPAKADALDARSRQAPSTRSAIRPAVPFQLVSAPPSRPTARDAARAPVLLFRTLQQQERVRKPPIRALPVAAPGMERSPQAIAIPIR